MSQRSLIINRFSLHGIQFSHDCQTVTARIATTNIYVSCVLSHITQVAVNNNQVRHFPTQSVIQGVAALSLVDYGIVWTHFFVGGIANSTISLYTLGDDVYYTVSFVHNTTMMDQPGSEFPVHSSSHTTTPYATHLFRSNINLGRTKKMISFESAFNDLR